MSEKFSKKNIFTFDKYQHVTHVIKSIFQDFKYMTVISTYTVRQKKNVEENFKLKKLRSFYVIF